MEIVQCDNECRVGECISAWGVTEVRTHELILRIYHIIACMDLIGKQDGFLWTNLDIYV